MRRWHQPDRASARARPPGLAAPAPAAAAAIACLVLGAGSAGTGCGRKERDAAPGAGALWRASKARPSLDGTPPLRVTRVRVRDRTLPTESVPRISEREVREVIVRVLGRTPGLRWAGAEGGGAPGGARGAYVLEADLELQGVAGSEKAKASVLLSVVVRSTRPDLDGLTDEAASLREQVYRLSEASDRTVRYRSLLREAVSDVLGQVAARWRLRHAPADAVARAILTGRLDRAGRDPEGLTLWLPVLIPSQVGLLGDFGLPALAALARVAWAATPARQSGASVRALAIRVAASRRLRAAVPALVRVLQEASDGSLRDLCLGALAEIRDPRAVPAILKFLRGDPDGRLRKVVAVLGQIGGPEAEAFLEMTADGQADEDVRELARLSLQSLRRRAARRHAAEGPRAGRRPATGHAPGGAPRLP